MILHKYSYLISSQDEVIFWIFNGETHKKKILDLRNVSNLKELQFYSGDCEIVRIKGRSTNLCHSTSAVEDENDLECRCNEFFSKYAWIIYSVEFERLIDYFKIKGLRTRTMLD